MKTVEQYLQDNWNKDEDEYCDREVADLMKGYAEYVKQQSIMDSNPEEKATLNEFVNELNYFAMRHEGKLEWSQLTNAWKRVKSLYPKLNVG
jgi:hypothetical protein